MARKTERGASGTSFHNTVLKCSVNDLIAILGEPTIEDNTGEDKVNSDTILPFHTLIEYYYEIIRKLLNI